MNTAIFIPEAPCPARYTIPFEDRPVSWYLDHPAARKQLNSRAHTLRKTAWTQAEQQCGLAAARAGVEQILGKQISAAQAEINALHVANAELLTEILRLEAQLLKAEDAPALLEYNNLTIQLASQQAQAAKLSQQLQPYTRAFAATQAAYTRLVGGIPIQAKLVAVRRALHARRAQTVAQIRAQIGTRPPGQLSVQIQKAQLDERAKAALLGELRDQAALAKCARQAARAAAQTLAAQMRQGQGIYADECPSETADVQARGSRIVALSENGNIVAEWGVAPDGAAYLVRCIMPRNPVSVDQVPPGARFVHQGHLAVKCKHNARWYRGPRRHFRLPPDTPVHIRPRVRQPADAGGWTTVLDPSGKELGRFPAYTRLIPRHALRRA